MATNMYLPRITVNIIALNDPVKIHSLAAWTRKQEPYMLSTSDPPQNIRYTRTKGKQMEKNISSKWKGKKQLGQRYLYLTKQILNLRFQNSCYCLLPTLKEGSWPYRNIQQPGSPINMHYVTDTQIYTQRVGEVSRCN